MSQAAVTGRSSRIDPVVWRALFAVGVLFYALATAARRTLEISFSYYPGGDPWMAGDWLINYGGGFVRRGMFGELFLTYAPSGDVGLAMLFAFQIGIYLVLFGYALDVLFRTRFSWSSIALVVSPAGLAFIGWVPSIDAAFRKELLVLLVLALLAWSRRPERSRWSIVTLVTSAVVLYVLAVFSWEPSALLLPAALYLLVSKGAPHPSLTTFRRSAAAVVLVIAGVGAILSALIHGDVATADAICQATRDHGFTGPYLCSAGVDSSGGAIEAIGWTSYKTTQDLAIATAMYVGYLPLLALSLVPVVLSRWFKTHWLWAVAIVVAVVPLYFIVTDYGRWTSIVALALMLCITADDPDAGYSRWWNPVGTVLFVALWGMPHWWAEAQFGEIDWPNVSFLASATGALIDKAAIQGVKTFWPDLPGNSVLDYTARFLAGSPNNGTDSWEPMTIALHYLHSGGTTLYQSLFFEEGIKFQYPPTSLLFLEPFAPFTRHPAPLLNAITWFAVVGTAYFLFRIAVQVIDSTRPGSRGSGLTAFLAVISTVSTLTYYPIMQAWDLGQAQGWINFLCVWSLAAYLRGQKAISGVTLALACLLKPQLALFVLWALVRREWRFLVFLVSTGAVGLLVSIARYGLAAHLEYLRVLSFLTQRGEVYFANQSLNGFFSRLLGNGDPVTWEMSGFPPFHPVVFALTTLSTILFISLAVVMAARTLPRSPGSPTLAIAGLDYSIALLCFTLASPIAWEHHYGGSLPAYFITTLLALTLPRRRAIPLVVMLVLSYALTTTSHWTFVLAHRDLAWFLFSYFLAGALLLLASMLLARHWLGAPTAESASAGPRRVVVPTAAD